MASRMPEDGYESLAIVLQVAVRIIFLANSCRVRAHAGKFCRARQNLPTAIGKICRATRKSGVFAASFHDAGGDEGDDALRVEARGRVLPGRIVVILEDVRQRHGADFEARPQQSLVRDKVQDMGAEATRSTF